MELYCWQKKKNFLSLHQSPTQCRPLLCLNQNQCLLLLLSPQNCHVSYKMSCVTNAEAHISTFYKIDICILSGLVSKIQSDI